MQDGTLVKYERNRYTTDKNELDTQAQSRLCQTQKQRITPSALIKVTPSTLALAVRGDEKKPSIESEVAALKENAATVSQTANAPVNTTENNALEATKAVNVFLTQLAGNIRSNVNYSSSADEKLVSEVEITLTSEGKIAGQQLVKSSGQPPWDAAVMKAVAQTQPPTPKSDFKMPKKVILAFSNREF